MGCYHMRQFHYMLNAVHVILHFGALFCLTVMWTNKLLYIQILDFEHWWNIFAVLTLVFTLAVSKAVMIGGFLDRPLVGGWNKPRTLGIYGFSLIFILISAGLQTWTTVSTASDPQYTARYITGTCFTWALAITWVLFMVAYACKYRDDEDEER
ncbi:hypothetical protein PENTCL1PPCAC_251 [Pristionchus entomophagus]|uniref:Uncharacterized protein n=1 Tax=Pristionchus entomophagus TaxID=358040 RepID=A0AAV5S621_9BILA|nr:hypothetical protein PENTCL1PPCAC_251 [Pristionchus entomophagus]